MARRNLKPEATSEEVLECVQQNCSSCGFLMWNEYNNHRHVRTLKGVVELRLKIRRCQNLSCERYRIAIDVKRCFRTLLAAISRWKHKAGSLESGITH